MVKYSLKRKLKLICYQIQIYKQSNEFHQRFINFLRYKVRNPHEPEEDKFKKKKKKKYKPFNKSIVAEDIVEKTLKQSLRNFEKNKERFDNEEY